MNLVGIAGPQTDYVKRVIGLPGDHVVCCNASGQITVNGVPLSESSYIYPGDVPSSMRFNVVVPPGRLWVMGDDRADSDDSRYRATAPGDGTIPESAVVGRAFLVIWPLSRVSDLPIPETFKQAALLATLRPPAAGGSAAARPWRPRLAAPRRRNLAPVRAIRAARPSAADASDAAIRSRSDDTLTVMSDDGAPGANETGGAWMSGSGARDGWVAALGSGRPRARPG